MSTFAYIAFDSKGKLLRGDIQEKSWTQALRRVKEMGLFPTSVKEKSKRALVEKFRSAHGRERSSALPHRGPLLPSGVSTKELTAFTRQIATLIEAGIPIIRGLRSIQEQEESGGLRNVLRDVITEIEGGSMFSEAIARHPKVFNRLYINMVVAGETAGMLEGALRRLADFMERHQKIRSRIVSALFYPCAVIVVAVSILMALMVFVVPRFKEVFADLTGSAGLPPFTEYVLGSSQFIKNHLLIFLGLPVGLILLLRFVIATRPGRGVFDRLTLRLPIIGRITRKAIIARFTRTLGTMLENGVPVLQALTIARDTTNNTVFARAIQQTHDLVKDGESLTTPLRNSGVFPSTVISMIDVGEQTGAMPNMLLRVADAYDNEVENAIASALSLLEPALIIFLAVVVGSIVVALFLPIINVNFGGGSGAPGE